MEAALESHDSIKGCRAVVIEVNTTRERNKESKIPGITVLNKYEECGIRVWKHHPLQ